MRNAAVKVFEWTALITWATIVGAVCMYGVLYSIGVIYKPQRAMERLPDRPFYRAVVSLPLGGDHRHA